MEDKKKTRVIVLGSTGSIGVNTLRVIGELSPRFCVVGLSAGGNRELLQEQIRRFRPEAASLADESTQCAVGGGRRELDCLRYFGDNGVERLVEDVDADIVVGAISGWAGFRPCVKALEQGRRLALANKETLVVGGRLVTGLAERSGAELLPVDSEESAIFQAMQAGRRSEVRHVLLTASGGPFHNWPADKLDDVTPEQALCHPNWDMGRKITIDSATLMNKALEIVETRWFFDIEPRKIKVLIHPQSIVHSMVEFEDSSILAQLGAPDMKAPIQYALTYPERVAGSARKLDFEQVQRLELRVAAPEEFPALELGYRVAELGGTSGAVMNAANEVAVDAFLNGQIAFTDIIRVVQQVLDGHEVVTDCDLERLEIADRLARREAGKAVDSCKCL